MYKLLFSYFYKERKKYLVLKGIFSFLMIIYSATNLNENIHAKSIISQRIKNINSKLISKK